LPVPACVATWHNQLDLVVLVDQPTDKLPAPYEEFDPYIQLRTGDPATDPALIQERGERPGVALRWRHRGQGIDTQIMVADVYSYQTSPVDVAFNVGVLPQPIEKIRFAPWRQQVAGLGVQTVTGNWLWRTEQAIHWDVPLAHDNQLEPWTSHSQWRAMAGFDYSGIHDLTVTAEFSWSLTDDYQSTLASDRWQTGASLRLNYTLMNERLSLDALVLKLFGDQGTITKIAADWALTDELGLELSIIDYGAQESSQQLYAYRHNDTVLMTLIWGF